MDEFSSIIDKLETIKRFTKRGVEYWMGRDLQPILGYDKWDNFENVILKGMAACGGVNITPEKHFLEIGKLVSIGSGAKREKSDYCLTRYACYLVAMNGESNKPEIGIVQSYFALQTRKQELQDQLTDAERRLQLRDRVRDANKSLASTAKKAGVKKYPIFQHAGYIGLYEMGLAEIKAQKGLNSKENLLDRAGRTELAANEFRITQTEEKLIRDNVNGEQVAIETHREVGREVRKVIKKIGGTMPEDLPAEEPIKKLMSKKRKALKDDIKKITD